MTNCIKIVHDPIFIMRQNCCGFLFKFVLISFTDKLAEFFGKARFDFTNVSSIMVIYCYHPLLCYIMAIHYCVTL